MKDVIKKSILYGLVGVPAFMISAALGSGIVLGVSKGFKEIKNIKNNK